MSEPHAPAPGLMDLYRALSLACGARGRLEALREEGALPASLTIARGLESVSVGAALALAEGDLLAAFTGDAAAPLARGCDPAAIFRAALGRDGGRDGGLRVTDPARGLLPGIPTAGSAVPLMAGAAMAIRMRGERRIAVACVTGAETAGGNFHEGLNLAAVRGAPLVVIVAAAPGGRDRARGAAVGLQAETVDGLDAPAVMETVRRAAGRARDGGGPCLIEAALPAAAAGRAGGAPAGETEALARLRARCLAQAGETREGLDALDAGIAARLEEALREARGSDRPATPEDAQGAGREAAAARRD